MPAGRMNLPLLTMGANVVALPVAFTTDAAGAVVDTVSPGNAVTVIKIPATTGQYRILLGRDDTRPDRYKSLLRCSPDISATAEYRVKLNGEDVDGTTPYVDLLVSVPSVSFVKSLGAPIAASAAGVHAAVAGNAANNNFPGAFTSPARPRNITATFAAGWDGGDITVTGTDQFGDVVSEVIADVGGATVQGLVAFATVTAASKQSVGAAADTVTLGWGDTLGLEAYLSDTVGVVLCDDVVEVAPVFNATNHTVDPTTATNGARVFEVIANFTDAPVAADPVSATIGVTLWLEG